tara:strand:+ start:92 stop:514 length:423 start_codon:yes stop_codon:yes gene_type:complete
MSETLSRTLNRDKPKANIVESMTKLFFQKTGAEEAVISIKENRQTRTGLQNNLYWAIVGQVRKELVCSEEVLHKHLREELLEVTYEELAGKTHERLKSTKKMNTKEMGLYIGDCIDYIQGDLIPGFKLNLPDNWRGLVVE